MFIFAPSVAAASSTETRSNDLMSLTLLNAVKGKNKIMADVSGSSERQQLSGNNLAPYMTRLYSHGKLITVWLLYLKKVQKSFCWANKNVRE